MSNSTAAVSGETALVVWDGATETIDMVLTLKGEAADAGWIMPTPAGTAVSLGDKAIFGKLRVATAPRVERTYRYLPSLGVGASGSDRLGGVAPNAVQVTTTEVGPFTVSTLSSTDPEAVNAWLADHAYPTRPALTGTFGDYLSAGWVIQAVKLTSPGGQLVGDLDPLRMSFRTASPVYPIKLSRHARDTQLVTLYLAAPHRMEVATEASDTSYTTPLFAGRVPAGQLGIAALDGDAVYLTAFTQILEPASITGDYTFRQAADDTPYQRVVYEVVDRTWVTGLVVMAIVGVMAVGLVVGTVRALRRR